MSGVVEGVIHGKTIELAADPGIADGQKVEVTIRPVVDRQAKIEAILRTSGSMADDPDFEAVMEQIERERRGDFPRDLAP
jgi:hypothetical protein